MSGGTDIGRRLEGGLPKVVRVDVDRRVEGGLLTDGANNGTSGEVNTLAEV
jgi:hypothetical protein